MRSLVFAAVAALLLVAFPVSAETPYNCHPGFSPRLQVSTDRTQLRFTGRLETPAAFDPTVDGLRVDVSYEPETDPANGIFSVSLPASGFSAGPGGVRYRDPAGTVGGVTFALLHGAPGAQKFKLSRNGPALPGPLPAGQLRVVVSSGSGCVRTCGSPCRLSKAQRLVCHATGSPILCGVRSGCELIGAADHGGPGGQCLLPYPSTTFLADDPSTVTGKRMDYRLLAMPVNNAGTHISPAAYGTLDGYSPGPIVILHFVDGVDLAASNIPPLTNYPASLAPASPTVLIEADSPGCVRIEHFGENDVSIAPGNVPVQPPGQVFMIRPGRRLKNGTRYIVALRNLIDQNAAAIPAPVGFAALRDGMPTGQPALEDRRAAFAADFTKLETDCGVPRSSLTLAWDFTTASDDAIERYLLAMRDQTFAALGPNAPAFTVTQVQDDPFGDPRVCRRVRGTYTVPLYTTFDGPGSLLDINPATNLPVQNGTTQAPFTAMIPCSLTSPTPQPGRPIFYGHGLLGSGDSEVSSDHLRTLANTYGFVVVATDWQGMSINDYATVIGFLSDLSGFRTLPERLHQGQLNQLVLGHLLGAPDGLSTDPAFQYGVVSVIDPSAVFYYGNSQGGILGGVVMALEQETTRGVLGVPAANFSTLLQRSVDFETFFVALRASYPNDIDRSLIYPLLQQLWDRSEPNGWYHHTLSNPLPSTPTHKVLVHMATSDAEVSNVATQIMVRTMGMPQVSPVVQSYFGIPEMAAPFDGSAMLESNEGDPPPPTTNLPPPNNMAHGAMRKRPTVQAQIDRFLRTGGDVEDFCVGPCDPE
jgi:hypothetical protein